MNKFDKEIFDKLDGYSSPVDMDLWDKIANNLPEQETSSSRHWLLPAFGILTVVIGLIVGGYFIQSSGVDNDQINASAIQDQTNSNELERQIGKENSNTLSNQNQYVNKQRTVNHNEIHTQKTNTNIARTNQSTSQINNATSLTVENVETTENKSKSSKSNLVNKPSDDSIEKSADEIENSESENVVDKVPTATLYEQYNSIFKKSRNPQNNEGEIIERKEAESFERLPMEIELLKDENEKDRIASLLSGKRTICPTFSNLRFGIFAEAFYSNDFGLKALSYNSPVTESDYLNARNRTESAQYSFSTGARVSFLLPSGIGAKTGLSYTQINESFKYEDPNAKQTKTVTIKEYQWENNMIVDSTEITKEIEVPGKLSVINQNKYKIIDLPLLFTYEWGYKKRMYYAVTAGPMFNIRFTQQGMFLDPETLKPVDFSTDSGNYKAFNTNIGTSIYLSFALNYQLGDGVDVFVEPNMRHFLKNATLNTYLLNQRYTVLGLGFGLKYKI